MANERTFTCPNCGAEIQTSAAPGTTVNCEHCGSPFTVPPAGTPAAHVVESPVRRGQPQALPREGGPGELPPTSAEKPAPESPAGVGYTVDSDAVAPTVGRDPSANAGQEITPIAKPSGAEPTAADLIAEPLKYGLNVGAGEGEPVVVPPNKVVIMPPQHEGRGGPPGRAMTSNRNPVALVAGGVGCCLLLALASAACVALQWGGSLFGP
jgi:hypothetical protein